MRAIRFAQAVGASDEARRDAQQLVDHAGLPAEDLLGRELALAIVVRAKFLQEHPHLLYVLVDGEEFAPGEGFD